MNSITSIRWP